MDPFCLIPGGIQNAAVLQSGYKGQDTNIHIGVFTVFFDLDPDIKRILSVALYVRDIDMEHKKAEYGVFIGETDCYGKGYGTEAAELMCEYAFSYLGLHKLMLRVYAENERAIKSYEKAGFVKEAYLKDDVFVQGKYRDVVLMAMFHEEDKEV